MDSIIIHTLLSASFINTNNANCFINVLLVCTYGNSTGSLLLPPPLFSKPVAPPPPLQHTAGGSLLSMLTTQNTLINMKEVTN